MAETIIPQVIEEEMKQAYVDYAMSVIIGRALPDVRDGLKPVHRRILFAMKDLGLLHSKPFKKSARIVGECFVKDTLVVTNNGVKPIQDLKRNDKVYTQDGLRKITELYEMPKRPLLTVTLKNGLSNTVTKSQMFKVLTPKLKIKWKKASDLKKGDYIVSRQVYPVINKQVKLAKNKNLNNNLAYLLGFFLSDGWVEKSTGRVGFFSVSLKIINKIKRILKEEFNYKPLISIKKNDNFKTGYTIRISKSNIFQFFTSVFECRNATACTKKIPKQVFQSPREVINSFLSGLIDGDGSIHKSRNIIHYGSVSSDLINQLQILLQSFGVYSTKYVIHTSEHKLNGRVIKANYPFYSLEVRGPNCLVLAESLQLQEENKTKNLIVIRKSLKKKNMSDNIPYAASHVFSELSKHHLGAGWYKDNEGKKFRMGIKYPNGQKIRYSKNLHNRALGKDQIIKLNILKKLERIGSPLAHFLNETIDNDLQFIKVKEITEASSDKTYDIQVEKDHEFIANGMLAHNCLGKYHPHGDTALYDSLVRMAQDWSMRSLLISGQGNFGSVDGDSPAALRYTEARLTKYAEELLEDIDKETVDFTDNFDGSLKEPTVLPSKAPNLLINGSQGIAVGMATNIPPHNLRETCAATIAFIDNPEISTQELMEHLPGPDFPTGGEIAGRAGIASAYATGRGKIRVKGVLEEDEEKRRIIITEIPYLVNKALLVEQIADMVRDKRIPGIRNIRDESNREGMRVVVELKQGAQSSVVVNQLYKYTRLKSTFGVIMLAIVDGEPRVLPLKSVFINFVNHRREIITRRTQYSLRKAEERSHLLKGLIIALNNIDTIVEGIKKSSNTQAAREFLVSTFSLTEIQANAILEMKLQKLSSLEQEKIRTEQQELLVLIEELKSILSSEQKILDIIKDELRILSENYGDDRRTKILDGGDEDLEFEDLIAERTMVITLTHNGYMKRLPLETYRQQRRGGKGVIAAGRKAEDLVKNIFVASTHSYLLFFTDKGQIHWCKVYSIPETSRQAAGKPIINLINIDPGEKVTSIIPIKNLKQEQYLMMCTKKGIIKKTSLIAFSKPRKAGIRAITLDPDDELVGVVLAHNDQQIIIASEDGLAVRFKHTDVRPMGRSAMGVRGIRLKSEDKVVGLAVAEPGKNLLTITKKGYGKQTSIDDYRLINRGGKGVTNIKITEKNGKVVDVRVIEPTDELMLISKNGIAIRIPTTNISTIGRATQGVRVMRLAEGDEVVAVARIINEEKVVEEAASQQENESVVKESDELTPPWETNLDDGDFNDDLPDELLEGEEEQ